MFRLLKYLFVALLFYYLYRAFINLFSEGVKRPQETYRNRENESDLKVKSRVQKPHSKDFKGGEYIDYEEVD